MAIRFIRTDKESCLYKVSRPVQSFDEHIGQLLDDMFETMYDADGVGLAAPQIGILRRALVIDVGDGPVEMINPKLLSSDGIQGDMEGCLSFPGQSGYVERAEHVVVEAFNRKGEKQTFDATGLFARAIQHEMDHLDGIVYLTLKKEPPEEYIKAHQAEEEESEE